MSDFVHLHVHSEYSLLDGAARISELVQAAVDQGMQALALTDHGVMYGAIPFYKACLDKGIKPIIGCEVYLTLGSRHERKTRQEQPIYHLLLLARNEQGYRHLMTLCSIAHLEGFHYKPRVDLDLLRTYAAGLICTSSCMGGAIPQFLLQDRQDEAYALAEQLKDIYGEDFYLEVQDHGLPEQRQLMQQLAVMSTALDIPLVATNDVHYVHQHDDDLQDMMLCIGTGKTVGDTQRLKFKSDQYYLKSGAEMEQRFAALPQALAQTKAIADKCSLQLNLGRHILPVYQPLPPDLDAAGYLRQQCQAGLAQRYDLSSDAQEQDNHKVAELEQRLAFELSVIERMGYSDYFLIVWDFIRFAREQGIAVGPGRGSSAGSLAAYCLRITDVDPIRYGLLFERFLNPERISMPDIDVDFSDERRDEVIRYVADKYGQDHVAQIIAFGTMAARAAVRDVGRVLDLPSSKVDRTARMIPAVVGMTIDKALTVNPKLRQAEIDDEEVAQLLQQARRVEGMTRHATTHAAGVVISDEPLTWHTPLQSSGEGIVLTQYSMEHLEAAGLLKMDFLGLRTLSILERTQAFIKQLHGQTVDFGQVGDDDPATYHMIGQGHTTGVFQLESAGMRRVLRDLKPNSFEDIISVLALYRPGPMDFIPQFIQTKHGERAPEYPHPDLEPILADTYGIIVYQEQIMQIASRMAGFSLGEADLLRRAVSKKKREVLDQERQHFVQGSQQMGYRTDEANRVYDMIVRFADYGFPRAHAAAYGVLAYQTAYMKANYPVPFMASMLTAAMGNQRKMAEYAEASRREGIVILPPDVNESLANFSPTEGAIRFGLSAVKNVGVAAITSIIAERSDTPYADLLDFCLRVDHKACNKRVMESLIHAGAFDSLPGHRAQLLVMLDETLEAAVRMKKEREDLQLHLFGFQEQVNWTVEYPEVEALQPLEQLEKEKDVLGLYLSGHPLDSYDAQVQHMGLSALSDLSAFADEQQVWTMGMVVERKAIVSRKGQSMAFIRLEDRVEQVEVVLFPRVWSSCSEWLDKGSIVGLQAKVQHEEEEHVKLLADWICPLEEMPKRLPHRARTREHIDTPPTDSRQPVTAPLTEAGAHSLYIRIASEHEQPELLRQLQAVLRKHPGGQKVILFYERTRKAAVLNAPYQVADSTSLIMEIEKLLGSNSVVLK